MKLWTPNYKTIKPSPICDRCGGIDGEYWDRNRRRFGIGSFHWRCVCCSDPPTCETDYVTVTFSGVVSCPGCWRAALNDSYNRIGPFYHAVTLDFCYAGSFTRNIEGVFETIDNYQSINPHTTYTALDRYVGSTTCDSGAFSQRYTPIGTDGLVWVKRSDGIVGRVEVSSEGTVDTWFRFSEDWTRTDNIDIPNKWNSCNGPQPTGYLYNEGYDGTATVEGPYTI